MIRYLLPLLVTLFAASDEPQEIRFQVTEMRSDDGTLACGLFGEEGWLREGTSAEGEITDGIATCVFRDVVPGVWGISVYHDENGNGELDTGWFRIPKEGTGASNDARGRMGPPKFEDAKFVYEGGVFELEGTLHYR